MQSIIKVYFVFFFIVVNAISNVSISGPMFLKVGQEVSYTCIAQGAPSNTYVWKINEMILNDNNLYNITKREFITSSISQLTIFSVNATVNKGVYACIVSNAVEGSEESSLVVTG